MAISNAHHGWAIARHCPSSVMGAMAVAACIDATVPGLRPHTHYHCTYHRTTTMRTPIHHVWITAATPCLDGNSFVVQPIPDGSSSDDGCNRRTLLPLLSSIFSRSCIGCPMDATVAATIVATLPHCPTRSSQSESVFQVCIYPTW